MYIGNQKVKSERENGDMVDIVMKDKTTFTINKELLEQIKTEKKGEGSITDNVNHYFARKFVAELAYYDLDFYFIGNIGQKMEVLAHNLREKLFRKTFDCSGGDAIPLNKLITNDEDTSGNPA